MISQFTSIPIHSCIRSVSKFIPLYLRDNIKYNQKKRCIEQLNNMKKQFPKLNDFINKISIEYYNYISYNNNKSEEEYERFLNQLLEQLKIYISAIPNVKFSEDTNKYIIHKIYSLSIFNTFDNSNILQLKKIIDLIDKISKYNIKSEYLEIIETILMIENKNKDIDVMNFIELFNFASKHDIILRNEYLKKIKIDIVNEICNYNYNSNIDMIIHKYKTLIILNSIQELNKEIILKIEKLITLRSSYDMETMRYIQVLEKIVEVFKISSNYKYSQDNLNKLETFLLKDISLLLKRSYREEQELDIFVNKYKILSIFNSTKNRE